MKFKLNTYTFLLYFAAFYNFVIEMIPGLTSFTSIALILMDGLIICLGVGNVFKKHNRFSLLFLLGFLVWSTFGYLVGSNGLVSHLNGIREILILLLTFPLLKDLTRSNIRHTIRRRLYQFSTIFLIAQVPATVYQYMVYGAGDHVGGTLGFGYSGILTLITILLVYFRIKEQFTSLGVRAYYNLGFLLPIFLNETKVSFILLPLLFLALVDFRKISSIVMAVSLGPVVFILLNTYYSDEGKTYDNTSQELFSKDFLEYYLVGDNLDDYNDIPRFSKLILGGALISKDVNSSLFGMEYGAFKGGTTIQRSSFATKYHWLLLGSVPYLFYLIISGGWGLVLLIISYINGILWQEECKNKKLRLLLFFIFLLVLFYNEAFRIQIFLLIYGYLIFYAKSEQPPIKKNRKKFRRLLTYDI